MGGEYLHPAMKYARAGVVRRLKLKRNTESKNKN